MWEQTGFRRLAKWVGSVLCHFSRPSRALGYHGRRNRSPLCWFCIMFNFQKCEGRVVSHTQKADRIASKRPSHCSLHVLFYNYPVEEGTWGGGGGGQMKLNEPGRQKIEILMFWKAEVWKQYSEFPGLSREIRAFKRNPGFQERSGLSREIRAFKREPGISREIRAFKRDPGFQERPRAF